MVGEVLTTAHPSNQAFEFLSPDIEAAKYLACPANRATSSASYNGRDRDRDREHYSRDPKPHHSQRN